VPSKSLQRETGVSNKDAFYQALHSLEEKGEVKVDKDHWARLAPPAREVEATLVSISERFGFARPKTGEDIFVPGRDLNGAFLGDTVLLCDLQKRDRGPSGRERRVVKRAENKITGTVHVDEAGLKNKFGQYLNAATPYEANYNNTLGYVFYYLKFKDDISANKYFEAYYDGTETDEDGNTIINQEELKKRAKVYISDKDLNIKFDQMLYLVAGNVMNNYYNAGGAPLQKATYFGDNQQPELRLLEEGQRIGQKYVGYQLGLTPSKNTTGVMRLSPTAPRLVSETIVNFQDPDFKSKVTEAETVKTEADTGVSGAVLRICKGDYTVSSAMKGLLVADGDVTVSADFTGLILATGKVNVAGAVKMQSDMVTVGKLFDYIRTDEALSPLFRDLNGTLKKRPGDLAECIGYQNWVKNSY